MFTAGQGGWDFDLFLNETKGLEDRDGRGVGICYSYNFHPWTYNSRVDRHLMLYYKTFWCVCQVWTG